MKKFVTFILYSVAVLQSYGQSAESVLNFGDIRAQKGDYTGAIVVYTKAIKLNPKFGEAYLNRGVAKFNLQDYRGAIADYTKAIELNPKDAKAYYSRGFVKFFSNDKDGACLDWSKAGELGDGKVYDVIKKYCN